MHPTTVSVCWSDDLLFVLRAASYGEPVVLIQLRDLREALRRSEAEARDAARSADARQAELEASASTAEARVGEVKRRLAAAEGEAQRKGALVQVPPLLVHDVHAWLLFVASPAPLST